MDRRAAVIELPRERPLFSPHKPRIAIRSEAKAMPSLDGTPSFDSVQVDTDGMSTDRQDVQDPPEVSLAGPRRRESLEHGAAELVADMSPLRRRKASSTTSVTTWFGRRAGYA